MLTMLKHWIKINPNCKCKKTMSSEHHLTPEALLLVYSLNVNSARRFSALEGYLEEIPLP